ncbi:MAG: hypothetical protein AAF899_07195 [Pseudomonadota bacterium]
MADEYVRITRARSPLRVMLPVIGVAFCALGLAQGAPWFWFIPIGLFVGLSLLGLTRRDAAFRIGDREMAWQDGGRDDSSDATVPLDAIARVEIVDWSDSTDYHVHCRDGATLRIPATVDTGPTQHLIAALTARGIPVERR